MAETSPTLLEVSENPEQHLVKYLDGRFPNLPKFSETLLKLGVGKRPKWPPSIEDQERFNANYAKTPIPTRVKFALFTLLFYLTSHQDQLRPNLTFEAGVKNQKPNEAYLDYTYSTAGTTASNNEYFAVADNRDLFHITRRDVRNRLWVNTEDLVFHKDGKFSFLRGAHSVDEAKRISLEVANTRDLPLSSPLGINQIVAQVREVAGQNTNSRKVELPKDATVAELALPIATLKVELPLVDSVDEIIKDLVRKLARLVEG